MGDYEFSLPEGPFEIYYLLVAKKKLDEFPWVFDHQNRPGHCGQAGNVPSTQGTHHCTLTVNQIFWESGWHNSNDDLYPLSKTVASDMGSSEG